jgi:hypothetical protein
VNADRSGPGLPSLGIGSPLPSRLEGLVTLWMTEPPTYSGCWAWGPRPASAASPPYTPPPLRPLPLPWCSHLRPGHPQPDRAPGQCCALVGVGCGVAAPLWAFLQCQQDIEGQATLCVVCCPELCTQQARKFSRSTAGTPCHLHAVHWGQCLETGTPHHPAACTLVKLDCTNWRPENQGPPVLIIFQLHTVSTSL